MLKGTRRVLNEKQHSEHVFYRDLVKYYSPVDSEIENKIEIWIQLYYYRVVIC